MAIALVVALVVAAAALLAALLAERGRRRALGEAAEASRRASVAEAEREAGERAAREAAAEAAARTAALEAAGEEERAEQARLREQLAEAGARLERQAERQAELEAQVEAMSSQLSAVEAALAAEASVSDELRAELRTARAGDAHDGEGPAASGWVQAVWALVLARVERQWAAAVAARPEERGWRGDGPAAQLTEALGRELDRLREEAGLYAELAGESAAAGPRPDLLLGTGELLATLAASADRLAVRLGEDVAVTAEGWTGTPAELDPLRAVLGGAGLELTASSGDGAEGGDGDALHVTLR